MEFFAENHFPRKKMYEKSAPGHPELWIAIPLEQKELSKLKSDITTIFGGNNRH
jgi:hypothetical protein